MRQDNESEARCLLGHYSSLTKLCVSDSHVITCDRDGRIRASRWPECYVVVSFCLGHADAVTALASARDGRVVSGAADGTLRLWNIADGACVASKKVDGDVVQRLVARKEGEEGQALTTTVVTDILVHPTDENVALFTVHGGRAVFKVRGICGESLEDVQIMVQFEDVVSGMATDNKFLWVSVEGSRELKWINGRAHNGVGADEVSGTLKIGDDEGRAWENYPDIDLGRYEWLVRQRKKEMVEDWKGKKRRRVEIT